MQTVKMLVDKLPDYHEGDVIRVDENSAAVLVERREAELFDPDKEADGPEFPQPEAPKPSRKRRHGTAGAVQVADADIPDTGKPADTEADAAAEGDGAGD